MKFDKLCIATGGEPKKPEIPGADSKYVFTLRNAADQEKIKERAAEVKDGIAIIGSGFIGSESAAALKMKYKNKF
jgi:NAD(P)H-nitrite reductase large subunit